MDITKINMQHNLPNYISIMRIMLSILFVYLWIQEYLLVSLILLALAFISDFLDGFLARYLNQQTLLGQIIDPLADKIMFTLCNILLFAYDLLPLWFILLNLSKDIFLIIGSLRLIYCGKISLIKPLFVTKLNTVLQMMLIIILFISIYLDNCCNYISSITNILIYASSFLMIYFMTLYTIKYNRITNKAYV